MARMQLISTVKHAFHIQKTENGIISWRRVAPFYLAELFLSIPLGLLYGSATKNPEN